MIRLSIISLSILAVVVGLLLNFYKEDIYSFVKFLNGNHNRESFTPEELQRYNGLDKPELYLSLLGNVFEVTKGFQHYGPGKSYNAFVGRDASRSFVTGKFNKEDLTDDVTGLKPQDLLALVDWLDFYKKEYKKVGKLIGRYFNENGKPTQYYREIKKLIKTAKRDAQNEDFTKIQFPPCNIEWTVEQGSRVWCTNRSGGIDRNWIGVPRKLYEPGSNSHRCACINEDNKNLGNIKEYEGCNPELSSCYVKI